MSAKWWDKRWVKGVVILAILLFFTSCRSPEKSDREFRDVWTKLEQSRNWCFGHQRPQETKLALLAEDLTAEQRCQLLTRLGVQELRLGKNDEALKSINEAVELAEKKQLKTLLPDLRAERAVVWLRLAEVRNCVLTQGQSSCIFPLDDNAVHLDKKPAEKAFEDLLFYLQSQDPNPANPRLYHTSRWLLNITAMQLGRYPKMVPEHFRLELPDRHDQSKGKFKDVAAGVGIIEKNLVGGVAVEDIDGDGFLDILSSSCDYREPTRYYRNQGDGTFKDLTEKAGLKDQTGAFNVRLADYDGDGDMDILLLRGAFLRQLGEVRNSLLENDGRGHFQDVTHRAGLAEPAYPTGTACWGDFDGDGDLDLFVGNETASQAKREYRRNPCQLFRNNGDKTFTDVAAEAGVQSFIYVKGVACADIDNDGDLDLVVTNFGHQRVPANIRGRTLLYRNRGNGIFDEVGRDWGIEGPHDRAFATWFFDYDNDGWQDLYIACYETSLEHEVADFLKTQTPEGRTRLYRNNEGKNFIDVTDSTNLLAVNSTMGASFGDIDNDGYLDVYLGTGSAYYQHLVPNRFFQNKDGQSFEERTFELGLGHLQKGHGIAFSDFDNDGDQDIYAQLGGNFVGDAFSNSLFENPGNTNHFVHLQLKSDFQVLGAKIEIDLGDRKLHRVVGTISSFGHTPLRQEIGLGDANKIQAIVITWPSGRVERHSQPPVDRLLHITERASEIRTEKLRTFRLRSPQPGDPFCTD